MKYKTGDLVRFVESEAHKRNPRFYPPVGTIGRVLEIPGEYLCVQWPKGTTSLNDQWYVNFNSVEPANNKIVITTDGKTTLARMYEGKTVVKSAVAKCSPDDTFDFETGADLAFNRLIHDVDAREMEQPKREPIAMFYCTGRCEGARKLEKGNVYYINADGRFVFSEDDITPFTYSDAYDFLERNKGYAKGLVPLVKRHARDGEYIRLDSAPYTFNKPGEILKVASAGCAIVTVRNGDHANPSKEQPPDYEWSYADDSYHVLDGYQPICEHCGQALPK